jgi:hypothetical protein
MRSWHGARANPSPRAARGAFLGARRPRADRLAESVSRGTEGAFRPAPRGTLGWSFPADPPGSSEDRPRRAAWRDPADRRHAALSVLARSSGLPPSGRTGPGASRTSRTRRFPPRVTGERFLPLLFSHAGGRRLVRLVRLQQVFIDPSCLTCLACQLASIALINHACFISSSQYL